VSHRLAEGFLFCYLPLLKAFSHLDWRKPGADGNVANGTIADFCCGWGKLEQWVRLLGAGAYGGSPSQAPLRRGTPHNLHWLTQNGQRDGFGQINNECVYYELEAMVRPELKENGFFDKIFKREFSTANGHVAAKGIVPEGAHIVSLYQGRPPLCSPGDEFYFRIARCHL
jgi:hypothetical protein